MIAQLTGTLSFKAPDHCIIDVGGVGYHVGISLTTFEMLPELGSTVCVAIHTHVREDQLQLFGFTTEKERALFRKLIAISGIGPKMAIAMLSGLPTDDLLTAIGNEDLGRLTTIPGIGKKTAERIVVELKDKLVRDIKFRTEPSGQQKDNVREDVLSALTNLGYQRAIAENTLKKIEWSDKMPIEGIIRSVLRELCRA